MQQPIFWNDIYRKYSKWKTCFAKENVGSLEVLKEIPEAYYHSNEELLNKILGVKDLNIETYRKNYDIITLKYAREIIARKIINLLK